MYACMLYYTVKSLYYGHHWEPSIPADLLEVALYRIATIGTQESVHILAVSLFRSIVFLIMYY